MKNKFYAIRTIDGEVVNEIHTEWSECQKRVKGHNVQYKSFTSMEEAKTYLGEYKEEEKEDDIISRGEYIYYVDGSYMNDIIGWGYVLTKDDTEITRLAGGIRPILGKTSRNITGELEATKMAVRHAILNGIKKLYICHDYQGISAYVTGSWKADKTESKEYTNWMKNQIESNELIIGFLKVKGHTGHKWNEIVDEVAKKGTEL